MCVIAVKPVGVKLPDESILHNMWTNNPDGAGFMYPDGSGHVMIRKGFMKWKSFKKNLYSVAERLDATNIPMILHFRITTHGGTSPENTHPFPITDHVETLKKTSVCASIGVAHNGIIHSVTARKGLSDTMEYIASQLAPLKRALPNFLESKDAMLMIKNAIDSKMAFLTGDGRVYTIGQFTTEDGMLYSNDSFRDYYTRFRTVDWSKYDYWTQYDKGDLRDEAYRYKELSTYTRPEKWDECENGKRLMWLDVGDYVITEQGEMIEGDGYLIDSVGHVYELDMDIDYAVQLPGAAAYSAAGLPAKYLDDFADDFPTLVVNTFNKSTKKS